MQGKKNVMLMVPLLYQGGQERICALTARLLKECCNVCLVVFSTKDMIYDVSGVELIDLNMGSVSGFLGKICNVFRRIAAVKKMKKEKNIQISYSFGPSANLVNGLSRVNDKIWLGVRGYDALPDKREVRGIYRRADKVICCSKVMAEDVGRLLGTDEVEYLYNPCELERFRRLSEEPMQECHKAFFETGAPIIISVGKAEDRKGFWHQVKALALIQKEIPDTRMVFVGDGDFTECEKLAEDLKVRESILFAGVQKNPFSYLKKSSLYLMTSSAEGFPNALIEAMAVGVPVLSVNCKTGPSEILLDDYRQAADQHTVYEGEYGILLPVLNPVKNLDAQVVEEEECILAREAVKLLSNPQELDRLGMMAKKRSDCFTQEKYFEELQQKLWEV